MEKKLADFRAKKDLEKKSQQSLFRRIFSKGQTAKEDHTLPLSQDKRELLDESLASKQDLKEKKEPDVVEEAEPEERNWVFYVLLTLKVSLWLLLWKYFIELGFGAVYFIVSSSYLMYRNTRTGPAKKNHLSAYSVFNPNQERLDGTFTTEQFEKELRFGAASVK